MLARIAPLAAIAFTFGLVACSASADDLSEELAESSSAAKEGSKSDKATDDTDKTGGKTDELDKSGKDDELEGKESGGKVVKPDSDPNDEKDGPDPAPASSTCIATCKAKLKDKCKGDDAFCAEVCKGMLESEIACLAAAPTCDKSTWTKCVK